MERLLTCPACGARFSFGEWAKTACCPQCGARVDFIAATAGGATDANLETAAGSAGGGAAGAPVSTADSRLVPAATPSPGRERSGERLNAFGKPLALTRAWIVVFAIWAVAAGLLGAARIEMGRLPVLSARERAAVAAVEKARMADGTTYGQALTLVRKAHDVLGGLAGQGPLSRLGAQPPTARWYVIDRPWEHTVYVAWELSDPLSGDVLRLVWTVRGTAVKAESASYAYLQEAVKVAARNPGATTTSPVILPDPDALATAEPSPVAP